MRSARLRVVCGMLVLLALAHLANSQAKGTQQTEKKETGYALKKPVIGGAPPGAPWGAMSEVVKTVMKRYGWDVQICYYCNGAARAARLVSKAAMATPPERPSPDDLPTPKGPIDFGITGAEFLQWAYMGTNDFAKDPGTPQKQQTSRNPPSSSWQSSAQSAAPLKRRAALAFFRR